MIFLLELFLGVKEALLFVRVGNIFGFGLNVTGQDTPVKTRRLKNEGTQDSQ